MNRRDMMLALVGVVLLALVIALWVRATSGPPANRLVVAGDVRVDSRTVAAPAIAYPVADLSVGIPASQTAGPASAKRPTGAPARSSQPTISGTLVRMDVQSGDHVKAGQVIGQLDTKMLDLGVEQAEANAARAHTNTQLVVQGLKTISDNEAKLATAREQLATGRLALVKGAAALQKGKAALAANKAKLLSVKALRVATLADLAKQQKLAAQYAPGPVPPAILQKLGMDQAILGKLPKFAVISAGLKGIAKGAATIAQGEAKLASGAAKLAQGAAQLATGASALRKAKSATINARNTLRIVEKAQKVAVSLAKYRRLQATITAPVDGTVIYAVPQGTTLMVGAPVVRIQPDEPALVDTYLTADELGHVHLGSGADVAYDSAPGKVFNGTVAIVGSDAEYPPTSFPTDIVHMTRTVKVSIRLESGGSPPQGTPVEISIHTD